MAKTCRLTLVSTRCRTSVQMVTGIDPLSPSDRSKRVQNRIVSPQAASMTLAMYRGKTSPNPRIPAGVSTGVENFRSEQPATQAGSLLRLTAFSAVRYHLGFSKVRTTAPIRESHEAHV